MSVVRHCPSCNKDRDRDKDFYSWVDKKGVRRYQSYCKGCMKAYNKARKSGKKPPRPRDTSDRVVPRKTTAERNQMHRLIEQRHQIKRESV